MLTVTGLHFEQNKFLTERRKSPISQPDPYTDTSENMHRDSKDLGDYNYRTEIFK